MFFFTNPRFYKSYFYPTTTPHFSYACFLYKCYPWKKPSDDHPTCTTDLDCWDGNGTCFWHHRLLSLSVHQSVLYHKSISLYISVPLSLYLCLSLSLIILSKFLVFCLSTCLYLPFSVDFSFRLSLNVNYLLNYFLQQRFSTWGMRTPRST